MKYIKPTPITAAMIGAGTTVAEPAATETAWSGSSVAYTVGQERIRATTHRVYRCAVAHTSAASPVPEDDPTRWVDVGPTQRWAPFDIYTSTAATGTTSMTYVLQPGFFTAVALYGLVGTGYSITVKDAPGGTVLFTQSGYLYEEPLDWWEYYFVTPGLRNKIICTGIAIAPSAELTVTVTAPTGEAVGIGMIVAGDLVDLVGDSSDWGGTQYGSSAEPVTYSYINTADDGTTTIVRRHAATNLRCRVVLPKTQADQAVIKLQRVLDVPVAWIATDAQGFDGLTAFGLGQSSAVSYDGPNHASIDLSVKGLI